MRKGCHEFCHQRLAALLSGLLAPTRLAAVDAAVVKVDTSFGKDHGQERAVRQKESSCQTDLTISPSAHGLESHVMQI